MWNKWYATRRVQGFEFLIQILKLRLSGTELFRAEMRNASIKHTYENTPTLRSIIKAIAVNSSRQVASRVNIQVNEA